MSHSEFKRRLATDINRLEKQLRRLCEGRLTAKERDRLRVLDVACGECFEGEMLSKLLRELSSAEGGDDVPGVDFVGLDIREAEIARAAERVRSNHKADIDFRFLAGDGKRLLKESEEADVVFVRHQNYYLGGKDWHELFQQSLDKLAPDGKLIITSYFDHEHELAKDAIERVGGEIIEDLTNEEARALPTPGKCVDKRLAIFQRKR